MYSFSKVFFRRLGLLSSLALWLAACTLSRHLPKTTGIRDYASKPLSATPQAPAGDPKKGHDYVTTGDYIGSGIPWEFLKPKDKEPDTSYPRPGDNGLIGPGYNVFEVDNGVKVASANCFSCHGETLLGTYHLGLGDSYGDYAENKGSQLTLLKFLLNGKFGRNSPEMEAFQGYYTYLRAISPYIITPFKGPNPAFRLEEGCAVVRDPVTLKYTGEEAWDIIKYTVASDVPALWHVKKKTALYWNGMGRGDFSKLLMQASVLGIEDSTEAREVQQNFVDVVAWTKTLKPPLFPNMIDLGLATQGQGIFEEHCSRCHGTYGPEWTYPNMLVSLPKVGTDPYLALYFSRTSGLTDWYNKSWYATSSPASQLVAEEGYVAPPLDGVWATAPYFHNGSVPTLEGVLNSNLRPTYWSREAVDFAYDWEQVGWKYAEAKRGGKSSVYDTSQPGYGNQGHFFGDKLNGEDRQAVLEYLKTL